MSPSSKNNPPKKQSSQKQPSKTQNRLDNAITITQGLQQSVSCSRGRCQHLETELERLKQEKNDAHADAKKQIDAKSEQLESKEKEIAEAQARVEEVQARVDREYGEKRKELESKESEIAEVQARVNQEYEEKKREILIAEEEIEEEKKRMGVCEAELKKHGEEVQVGFLRYSKRGGTLRYSKNYEKDFPEQIRIIQHS